MKENNRWDRALFAEPPVEYRPVPFWGLTKELREKELLRQIEEMKDKGWGGFFMHARYPLVTPYLSDEYMELMRKCVLKAKELGIKAWIYDDHPWCSGSAGGLTASIKKEYRSKALGLNVHHRLTPIDPGEAMGYYALELDHNGVPKTVRRIDDPENDHGRERYFLHFYRFTEPLLPHYEPGFFDDCVVHGFASADNLNPEAVRRYIDVTYGRFEKTVGEELGKTLMGGFSDMPTYNWNYSTPHPSIPWTDGFEDYFRNKFGYDLVPRLPELFYDVGEDFRRVRCDYWKAASELFAESFTKQLYEWADRHGCIYSGHYWGEETLHWQIPWCGDAMRHFMYQQYVGMDHSVKTIEDPAGVKQASSAAEQLGKPRMIAESYGLSGNGLSHKQRKWIADWEYALGANFLVPYIAQYSLEGRAKRDEPASIFVQQPYWPYEKPMYDYYGRLSYALTRGKRVVGILLMQPLETARTLYTANKYVSHCYRPDGTYFESANAELYEYNNAWMALNDRLLALHRDYHIGNEAIMERFARVDGRLLAVGEYAYPVVIVPGSASWSASTKKLLDEFAKNGGTVIAVRPLPTLVGGVPCEAVLPESAVVIGNGEGELERALDAALPKDVEMMNCGDLLWHHRRTEEGDLYFVANTSQTESYPGMKIALPGDGRLELLDAFTGERFRLPGAREGGKLRVSLDFEPVRSYLLERVKKEDPALPAYRPMPRAFDRELELEGAWEVSAKDDNALVLDFCDIQVGGVRGENLPMHQAQQMVQQGGVGTPYTLWFRFTADEIPSRLRLVAERTERAAYALNGQALDFSGGGWWVDPAFRTAEIARAARKGENLLEIKGVVGVDTELESCFVIGDFAVSTFGGLRMGRKPALAQGRDVTAEGYPFFTGSLRLCKTVRIEAVGARAYLRLDRVDCTLARVWINGESAGFLAWEPYCVELTPWLRRGENRLEIELITTRRNLLGPHHYKFREQETFSVPARWINEAYWMDEYYFAPLGVQGARIGFAGA